MKNKGEMGEAIFSCVYLAFGLIAGIIMVVNQQELAHWYGILALVLVGGDSFHLVPRIIKGFKGNYDSYEFYAGLGLLVSSITMTLFYVILFWIWRMWFPGHESNGLYIFLLVCVALRIGLCLFPQNNWFKKEGNLKWGIYRNVPFAFVGFILIYCFLSVGMWSMALAIILSFLCYFPVVLWAKKNPKIGMLMLPKTLAYMWILCIGLSLL